MSEFVEVVDTEVLSKGSMMNVNVKGKAVLIANVDGTFYAMGDECTHRGCSLSMGWLKRHLVICACHLSRFNLRNGQVVGGPANHPEPTYEVKVVNGRILVKV